MDRLNAGLLPPGFFAIGRWDRQYEWCPGRSHRDRYAALAMFGRFTRELASLQRDHGRFRSTNNLLGGKRPGFAWVHLQQAPDPCTAGPRSFVGGDGEGDEHGTKSSLRLLLL